MTTLVFPDHYKVVIFNQLYNQHKTIIYKMTKKIEIIVFLLGINGAVQARTNSAFFNDCVCPLGCLILGGSGYFEKFGWHDFCKVPETRREISPHIAAKH